MFPALAGRGHCQISYGGGLSTSPCIMGLTAQDPYIQKEHTELYKIFKFRVNWANIEQDTTIQKLKNLQRNVWISCFEWLYLVQYWPNYHETYEFCKARCALSEYMGFVLLIP